MRSSAQLLTAAAVTLLLSGCASFGSSAKDKQSEDPALKALAQAADSVSSDLNQYRQLEHARSSREGTEPEAYDTPEQGPLAEPVTLNWQGPVYEITQTVAQLIGYDFRSTGKPPTQPLMVQVNVTNKPAYQVLEDIGWQVGERAGVLVSDSHERVKLVYESRDQ